MSQSLNLQKVAQKIEASREPTLTREEGFLHRVYFRGEDFWGKQWYRSHQKTFWNARVMEGERYALLSPYYAKMIELTYRIVNELFPRETVQMCGSYDKRVSNSSDGPDFDTGRGFPVTITRHVEGDTDKVAALRAIVDPSYEEVIAQRARFTREGRTREECTPFFVRSAREVNEKVRALLGDDINFGTANDPSVTLEQRIADLQEKSPDNVMLDMVEAGIMPIHPELNFIPGTPGTHERKPHGTFLEFDVYDLHKLLATCERRFAEDPDKLQEMKQMIYQLMIHRRLDHMFDETVFLQDYSLGQGLLWVDGAQGVIYRTLESLRKAMDVGVVDPQDPPDLRIALRAALQSRGHLSPLDVLRFGEEQFSSLMSRLVAGEDVPGLPRRERR